MQAVIVNTLYLLAIFIPLTFTTINYELFEFPKFIILISGTIIISVTWFLHALSHHDWQIFREETPKYLKLIHYSILAILLTQTFATIFSIHSYTSFWGYYSRFHQGLLTTICYTTIYFSAIKWLDKKSTQKIIRISVSTSILISLYAIAEHFGIDKNFWVQAVEYRVFSTLGQPNWLAAYLLPHLFLTLYLSQIHSTSSRSLHARDVCAFLLLFSALLFTKSRSGFLAFIFSYLTYWFLSLRQFSFTKLRTPIIYYSSFVILFVLIIGSPFTPPLSTLINKQLTPPTPTLGETVLESGGTNSGDIRKIVWSGAFQLIKKYPLLGTGPETFAYTYYWVRPNTHNYTSEWDFLYNKAHNEYLNCAATTGFIGLAAYLWWHLAILSASLKKQHLLLPVLGAGIIGFTITNFFGFSVIPVYLTMIFLAALTTTINQKPLPTSPSPTTHLLLIPTIFTIILLYIFPLKLFRADLYFTKGKAYLSANNPQTAIPLLQKAIKLRPHVDLYHSSLGEAYATMATTLPDSSYLSLAIKEATITHTHNPYHLNYYKSRAKLYLTLATINPQYNLQAAKELNDARSLSPTDPKLAYNLGLVYSRLGEVSDSIKTLETAVMLKNDYQEAYYALTLLYEQTKQTDLIPPLLHQAQAHLTTIPTNLQEKITQYLP